MITIYYPTKVPRKIPEKLLDALAQISEEFTKEEMHLILRIEDFTRIEARYEPASGKSIKVSKDNK